MLKFICSTLFKAPKYVAHTTQVKFFGKTRRIEWSCVKYINAILNEKRVIILIT